MSYPVYTVPAGDVLPIFFSTFDGGTGASVTLTGLAVTDIEIYKDGSVTQRSSDAGYTLLDTDGIDFDGVTGIHGFSIDTGDNTDSGFYTVGAWFHVVVSSVTVDSQTVNFIAAAFRIVPAEDAAGVPDVNVTHWLGTAPATPTTAGVPEVDLTHIAGSAVSTTTAQIGANVVQVSGDATAADNAEAFFDGTGYAGTNNVIPTVTTLTGHTPQTGDSFARLGAPAGASIAADIAAIEAQTDDIGAAGAGLSAIPWNSAWDAEVQSEVADALDAAIPGTPTANSINERIKTMDDADIPGALATVDSNVDAILVDTGTTLDGKLDTIDTNVDAILADTGTDGVVLANGAITAAKFGASAIDAAALATDAVTEISAATTDAVWNEARSGHTTQGTFGESFNGVVSFTVGASATTTSIPTDLTEATNDHLNGRTVVFITGALAGQATSITDYNGTTKTLTVTALTEAPAENDQAVIV